MTLAPFSETALFEQGNDSDPFYATGSVSDIGDGTFTRPLREKVQFRLSFEVANSVKMLPDSSSMYYFDKDSKQWLAPQSALSDFVGPFDQVSFPTIYIDPVNGTVGTQYVEDFIGFDSFGSPLISGSLNRRRNVQDETKTSGTFDEMFTVYSGSKEIPLLTVDYPKSVQRNVDYNAASGQTFSLPNTQPFLLEKVVVEVPFCFGPGWFRDKTAIVPAVAVNSDFLFNGSPAPAGTTSTLFNEGGPALSLALFCQKPYGTGSIRDLIARNVISHTRDTDQATVEVSASISMNFVSSYANGIGRYLTGSSRSITKVPTPATYFLTSSVVSKMVSSISNGLKATTLGRDPFSFTYTTGSLLDYLSKEYIFPIGYGVYQNEENASLYVLGVDPFGRGMTGFSPSGASIFGREYGTSQDVYRLDGTLRNPLFVPDEPDRNTIVSKINSYSYGTTTRSIRYPTIFALGSEKPSPYLLFPGEKLVLSISKTRPAFDNFRAKIVTGDVPLGNGTVVSSSYVNYLGDVPGHDVQLATGSINMTFYGSYVRQGEEYIP